VIDMVVMRADPAAASAFVVSNLDVVFPG